MSDISSRDSKLKNLIRIIFNTHLYEVLKLLIKMLRGECVVRPVKTFLNDNELNRVNKRRKKTMSLECGGRKNVTNRFMFKVRKMLNLLVFLEPSFVNTV